MQSAKSLRSWREKAISKVVTIINKTLKFLRKEVERERKLRLGR